MRIDVWRESSDELFGKRQGKSSAELQDGVERARAFAKRRSAGRNAVSKGLRALKDLCSFDKQAESFFFSLTKSQEMSARSIAKTLLLSRTIADIAESKQVTQVHIAEAFTLRFGGGLSW